MIHLENLPRTIDLHRDADGRTFFSFVDQTKLPDALVRVETGDWLRIVQAIKSLEVRGAPAIGVSGAAALALWTAEKSVGSQSGLQADRSYRDAFDAASCEVFHARPTAVNLAWAVDQVRVLVDRIDARTLPRQGAFLICHAFRTHPRPVRLVSRTY